jgi:hypothetical protein
LLVDLEHGPEQHVRGKLLDGETDRLGRQAKRGFVC